ncbi:MAG: bifunctional nuclease family protein [Flavobacteriales bacterium]|nr:bifunctional nuclease family protein [Flavobacteriales bacterium]
MKKHKLEIIGLSYSQTQSGAYALVLGETKGKRRLPIIIGSFEAQAIAIELEKMKPSRPLTHDLFKTFADAFDITIKETIIYNLVEGIFYAKLICDKDGKELEIDARTSDSIALAIRFSCPIYTYEFILSAAGIILEDSEEKETIEFSIDEEIFAEDVDEPVSSPDDLTGLSLKRLKELLQEAISGEDYELASTLRDEIELREKKS